MYFCDTFPFQLSTVNMYQILPHSKRHQDNDQQIKLTGTEENFGGEAREAAPPKVSMPPLLTTVSVPTVTLLTRDMVGNTAES